MARNNPASDGGAVNFDGYFPEVDFPKDPAATFYDQDREPLSEPSATDQAQVEVVTEAGITDALGAGDGAIASATAAVTDAVADTLANGFQVSDALQAAGDPNFNPDAAAQEAQTFQFAEAFNNAQGPAEQTQVVESFMDKLGAGFEDVSAFSSLAQVGAQNFRDSESEQASETKAVEFAAHIPNAVIQAEAFASQAMRGMVRAGEVAAVAI